MSCQIKLVPVNTPYFNNTHLLIAADCTAYAYANIHEDFMENKITIIGCPKLDEMDYSHKLTQLLANNNIKSTSRCLIILMNEKNVQYLKIVKPAIQLMYGWMDGWMDGCFSLIFQPSATSRTIIIAKPSSVPMVA